MNNVNTDTKKRYEIGSCVIYRAEGICDIIDIRCESFAGGEKTDYYILSPRNDPNSTVYVPVDNEKLTSMIRPLLSEKEIRSLIAELREERLEWIEDSRARNAKFKEILSIGERRSVLLLLNTVREHITQNEANGKRSGTTDTGALTKACKLLRDEFSSAISLSTDEALFALLDE
jgi:CarD family transcriptional regulator